MVGMRKSNLLITLAILVFAFIGTGFSTLYTQNELTGFTTRGPTFKVSYGFPLGWYGYSYIETMFRFYSPNIYWFSLGSLLLDTTFWFATSLFVSLAAIKSVNILHKTRASKNLSVINI